MHELPFAKSIFHSVMEKAEANDAKLVNRVVIEVGALRDFVPEIVDKYWSYVTRGSIAEHSRIEMRTIDATAQCRDCGKIYTINLKRLQDTQCPHCHCTTGTMLTGRELRIIGIEIS